MNLRQIEFASEIARTRSFTQAAKNLFISQPALSSQIKALEDELGFQLFIRNKKRPLELTDGGQAFLFHAQKIDADLVRMKSSLGKYQANACGEVRVGLFLTFGYTCIGEIIDQFRQTNENVRLKFKIGMSIDLLEELLRDEIDVAIVMDSYPGQLPNNDKLPHYLISQSELAVVTNRRNPLASRTSISLKDLDDEPTMMVSRHSPMYQTLASNMDALEVKPNVIGESSQADVVMQLAENNIAVGFLSVETHSYYRSEKTRAIPIYPKISRDVYFVCNKESRNVRWSRAFRDYVVDQLQAMQLRTRG